MTKTCLSKHRYSDLADEIKALKVENNILKDKIKASKRPVKVLVLRHERFTWKKLKTDAKLKFYTGIALGALFNTVFTLIKPYISHMTYWKGPKHIMRILKRTERKKNANIIKPS